MNGVVVVKVVVVVIVLVKVFELYVNGLNFFLILVLVILFCFLVRLLIEGKNLNDFIFYDFIWVVIRVEVWLEVCFIWLNYMVWVERWLIDKGGKYWWYLCGYLDLKDVLCVLL